MADVETLTGETDATADAVITEETVVETEVTRALAPDRVQHCLMWAAIAGIIAYLAWAKYEWIPKTKYPATNPGHVEEANDSALPVHLRTSSATAVFGGGA